MSFSKCSPQKLALLLALSFSALGGTAMQAQMGRRVSWETLAPLPGAGPISWHVAETPADPHRIYATSMAGVLVSLDRGQSWAPRRLPEKERGRFNGNITVSPSDPDVAVYNAWKNGLFRTEDGGRTWMRPDTPPNVSQLRFPIFAPSDPNRVYVAEQSGLWRSKDAGRTFAKVLNGATSGYQVLVDPGDSLHVYLNGIYELWESVDGGETWQSKNIPSRFFAIALDPKDGDHLIAGGTEIYGSTDGGDTWTTLSSNFRPESTSCLAFDPANSQRVYAAVVGQGFAISEDFGATWTFASDPALDVSGAFSRGFLPSSIHPGLLLLPSAGGIFRSEDGGQTFVRSNRGLDRFAAATEVAVDPLDDSHLVVRSGGTAFTSFDSGMSWTESSGFVNSYGVNMTADSVIQGRFYTSDFQGRFWRSDDGGLTFAQTAVPSSWSIDVEAHPTIGGRVFLAARGLFRSDDGGLTFTDVGIVASYVRTVDISPRDPNLVYCDADGTVVRSEDGGLTWSVLGGPGGRVSQIVADPHKRDRVWAAVLYSGGAYRSDDRGQTWTRLAENMRHAEAIAVLPWNSRHVLTNDFNQSTAHLSPNLGVTALELGSGIGSWIWRFTTTPTKVYAGTVGSGLKVAGHVP